MKKSFFLSVNAVLGIVAVLVVGFSPNDYEVKSLTAVVKQQAINNLEVPVVENINKVEAFVSTMDRKDVTTLLRSGELRKFLYDVAYLKNTAKPHCTYSACYTNWRGESVRLVTCAENGNINMPYIEPCPK